MYEHLFQAPMSFQTMLSEQTQLLQMGNLSSSANITGFADEASLRLKRQEYELKAGKMQEATDQFSPVIKSPEISTLSNIGTSLTTNYDSLSNNYLMNQKLRNSGLYSKLKNKTIYSKSEFVRNHSMLNSGIL